ncbi:MAG: antibiotic biosynthesis monooxygenase [Nitrosopumilus sp.]|nr:MAG: antibiotic biosynthesis monooxygenase [Nitrosopumilus sp.]QMU55425.1 MAG: antibiotic biosynthesis monooxygenase [Nitrosopumilus sp.]
MAIIEKNNGLYTIILRFDTKPESQQEHLDVLIDFFESVVSMPPGLVSTNFHKSLDGTRILNYTQWESKEDWNNAIHNKEVLSHPKNPIKHAKIQVHDYGVSYTFDKK